MQGDALDISGKGESTVLHVYYWGNSNNWEIGHYLCTSLWPKTPTIGHILPFFPTTVATHVLRDRPLLMHLHAQGSSTQLSKLLLPFTTLLLHCIILSPSRHQSISGKGDGRIRFSTGCSPDCWEASGLSSPNRSSGHCDGVARNKQRQRPLTRIDTSMRQPYTCLRWGGRLTILGRLSA
jgi:hypothetical protein